MVRLKPPQKLFQNWKIASVILEEGVAFLQVKRDRVIDIGSNSLLCKNCLRRSLSGTPDHILMKDMAVLILNGG